MAEYLPIFCFIVLATLFASLSFVASGLLSGRHYNRAKTAPYECGIVPTTDVPDRYPVGFYLVAMVFIVFDIEIIFLFPWVIVARQLGAAGLIEIATFSITVFIPFLYLLSHGALDWGIFKKIRPQIPNEYRTTSSTVQRIKFPNNEDDELAS